MTSKLFTMFAERMKRLAHRQPDFIIGGADHPYLLRWWLIPRNRFFNIYLHRFMRSDDDRATHDHPWLWNLSILLDGPYAEHTIKAGGTHVCTEYTTGDFRLRIGGRFSHRIELINGPVWTLFITGPRYRQWGFNCQNGWVHWKDFTAPNDNGDIGKGCAE